MSVVLEGEGWTASIRHISKISEWHKANALNSVSPTHYIMKINRACAMDI